MEPDMASIYEEVMQRKTTKFEKFGFPAATDDVNLSIRKLSKT